MAIDGDKVQLNQPPLEILYYNMLDLQFFYGLANQKLIDN
jgi:hypothetical protein